MAGTKKAPPMALGTMSTEALADYRLSLTGKLARVRMEIEAADDEIARRLMPSAKAAFEQAGKTDGTITLPLQGGLTAKVEVRKTVKWDTDELMKLAKTMPWERASSLFKIDFSMGETAYKGVKLADPALAAEIDRARTVKYSEPKIVLEKEGE